MDVSEFQSDVAAAIVAVKELSEHEVVKLEPGHVLVLPEGKEAHSIKKHLDEYLTEPERKKGTAKLETLDSFIEHVKRFQREESAVFATNIGQPALVAVYNYHAEEPSEEDVAASVSAALNPALATSKAGFGDHRAVYDFPLSVEWQAWLRNNGVSMTQIQFAEFIEERVGDVMHFDDAGDVPKALVDLGFQIATPSQLLGLSRGLKLRIDSEATQKSNLSTGEIEVSFTEKHNDAAGAPLKIPGGFIIAVRPFVDGIAYRIAVRLRYRVSSGKIAWSYQLHRADAALRDAVNECCEVVIARTTIPLFHGTPERA